MTGTVTRPTLVPDTSTRPPSRLALAVGGIAWIAATLQYFAAQGIAATAWHPPYSWTGNYISDLGNTACGPFAVPHGASMYVCSPRHALMNGSFVVLGTLFVTGTLLLRGEWHAGLPRWIVIALVAAGIGKAVVGLAPENINISMHLLGAVNVPLTSALILVLGVRARTASRFWSITGITIGSIGLTGSLMSTAGQFAGTSLYLGLGAGGMERAASYPANLWVMIVAFAAVTNRRIA